MYYTVITTLRKTFIDIVCVIDIYIYRYIISDLDIFI